MSDLIPFVTMKWTRDAETAEHKRFTADHVNAVLAMLRKSQRRPFRLICVTDDSHGLDPSVEVIPIPERGRQVINEHGGCWVQLYLFSKEFRERIGSKFIYSDLDVAIVGDMGAIYDRPEPLVITEGRMAPLFTTIERVTGAPAPRTFQWRVLAKLLQSGAIGYAWHYPKVATQRWCRFNGSFMVIDKDQPDDVWDGLDPAEARRQGVAAHILGSNQAWLQLHKQGPIATVGKQQGFWFKRDVEDYYSLRRRVPPNMRMIVFAGGKSNPWNARMQSQSWVRDVYPSLEGA